MARKLSHHGFLQQISRRSTWNETPPWYRWTSLFPTSRQGDAGDIILEMSSEVQKSEGLRNFPKFPVQFWNHYSTIMVDPDYPRTSNLVEGFHRGFKTRVNRARPTVQEYFRAIREQQVTTDFHLDRLAVGLTPSKKRRTSNRDLFAICTGFEDHSSTLEYLFAIAEFFGHTLTAWINCWILIL